MLETNQLTIVFAQFLTLTFLIVFSEKVTEATREIETSKQKFRTFKQQFSAEKSGYKKILADANSIARLEDEDGNPTALKERLDAELAQFNTIGLAEEGLEEAESKINDIHSDPNVVRLYEQKKNELEDTQEELDDLTNRKEKGISELERVKEPWFETLKKTIETVDKRFTKYMSELGCVGEISLKHGDDLNFSFKDYAVEIKVSFRANVAPTVLSSRVQSGGERSVSTIMYLMAMQDMMVSPFRCVDEINQGLDERNERLVFKRIVENSTQPPGSGGPTDHCGQYWLITPKLLPNLKTMEVDAMNVICIFNGT
jgi:chromosome segregation ATPase